MVFSFHKQFTNDIPSTVRSEIPVFSLMLCRGDNFPNINALMLCRTTRRHIPDSLQGSCVFFSRIGPRQRVIQTDCNPGDRVSSHSYDSQDTWQQLLPPQRKGSDSSWD